MFRSGSREKITRLRDHGAQITDLQRHLGNKPYLLADHPEPGLNQRMTDIQAALGVAQMSRVHDILRERRRLADIYNEAFESVDWLQTPFSDSNYEHGYQSFPCLFLPQEKGIKNIEKLIRDVIRLCLICNQLEFRLGQRHTPYICYLITLRDIMLLPKITQIPFVRTTRVFHFLFSMVCWN